MYEVQNHSWLGFVASTSHLKGSGLGISKFAVLFSSVVTPMRDYTVGFTFKEDMNVVEIGLDLKE